MRRILENLQQRDEPQKMLISLIFAGVFTFVLVASWLAWNSVNKKAEVPEEKVISDEITPASSLKSQFDELKSMFGEITKQFDGAEDILEPIPEFETEIYSTTSATTSEIESNVQ